MRLLFTALLLSLGQALFPTPAPVHVGVLYWSMDIPGQVSMRQGLEREVRIINARRKKLGEPLLHLKVHVAGNGQEGIENQIAQMNTLIDEHVDAIVVQPTDNAALATALLRANEESIPVFAYDQYISKGKLISYVTSNNYQAGYLDGEYIASLFPGGKTIRIVLVDYPYVSSTVERVNGFIEGLEAQGQKFKIIASYQAVEPVSGRRTALAILKDFPEKNSIDVIFTVNDGGGLAVIDALYHAGRREILVATIDGDPKSVQNIRNGRLTVIDSAQFCGPMGAIAVQMLDRHLRGENVPRQVLIPAFPVTRQTLDSYPGWQGPLPKKVRKAWPSVNPIWQGKLIQY